MSLVVGTAGHIDHGKTALLRALTGIDADRLPEEQRRGMTIDVGYAYLRFDDGSEIDFVDVPGHDRLVGNMLVGAGEVDAALLVVAADDGPRAQTLEHLGILDALGITRGLAVVSKIDVVTPQRVAEVMAAIRRLLDQTALRGVGVIPVSAVSGEGIEELRVELAGLRPRDDHDASDRRRPPRLAIDRVFSVRGRGVVVTGSLRGGAISRGDVLRAEPGGIEVRARELQVHSRPIDRFEGGGRLALNVAGPDVHSLRRGQVLTAGPGIEPSDCLLVVLRAAARAALRQGMPVRLHLGTDQVDGILDLSRRASADVPGGLVAIVRLERAVATAFDDPFVLRRPSPPETLGGGRVLDPVPPRGISRRRVDAEGLRGLARTEPGSGEQLTALLRLHGALPAARVRAWRATTGSHVTGPPDGAVVLAPDVDAAIVAAAQDVMAGGAVPISDLRARLVAALRGRVSLSLDEAAGVAVNVVERLVAAGDLVQVADRLFPAGSSADFVGDGLAASMDRLEALLAVAAPPSLREAARAAGCPIEGIRALEAAGRIQRVEDDLAWARATFNQLEALVLRLAEMSPVSPAAVRDATGTSRRFALAILEDLDRRGVLRRTPAGHILGPRARTASTTGTTR